MAARNLIKMPQSFLSCGFPTLEEIIKFQVDVNIRINLLRKIHAQFIFFGYQIKEKWQASQMLPARDTFWD